MFAGTATRTESLVDSSGVIRTAGQFLASDTATLGGVSMGTYTLVEPVNSQASFGGWWKIDVATSFNTTVKSIITPQFVIQDIITQNESKSAEIYYNTMDDVYALNQVTDPTKGGRLGHLSFYNKQGQSDMSPFWFFRGPKAWTDTLNVANTFTMRVNEIRGGAGLTLYDPGVLGLSFTYLNDTLHTVYDLWDGFVDVTFTNFDNNGNPFIPQVGDIIVDQQSGATATVAYLQEQLLDCLSLIHI